MSGIKEIDLNVGCQCTEPDHIILSAMPSEDVIKSGMKSWAEIHKSIGQRGGRKMNDEERLRFAKAVLETYFSLNESVDKAGGIGFSIKDLKEMSVIELISIICTNNIRFCFKEKES